MENNFIKFIVIFILIVIFIYGFSSSNVSHSIDNLAYVVAIGFDISDSGKSKITFQFVNTSALSEKGSSDKSTSVVTSVETTSIDSAVNLMNSYIGKELNLSHCKVIVFSEKFAQNDISDEIYTLINNIQIRPTTNIVISKCDANYYIKNSQPSLEQLVTKYYDIFPNSSSYTGYTENVTIGDFFNHLISTSSDCTAILGGINSGENNNTDSNQNSPISNDAISNKSNITGQRATENVGLAVFKNGKLVGELSAFETLWHLIIKNNINTFQISIPDPNDNNKFLDLSLEESKKIKIKVDISGGSPHITIDICVTGKIMTVRDNSDYLNDDYLDKISEYTSSYLKTNITNYLYKTSKTYKSDIDDFGSYASKYFLTIKDLENYKWLEKYENAFFTVNVNTNIKSSMLISGT